MDCKPPIAPDEVLATFHPYLLRWGLSPDGAPIMTFGSRLLPVRRDGRPAMLKIALAQEEQSGAALMAWWDGDGAASVLAHDREALLLERAEGRESLCDMARGEQDDEASRILCAVAARLHAPRARALPELVPLDEWFRALAPAAAGHGGIFESCAEAARMLLAAPRDRVVLHGDIHHGNILDFGLRGWLAIDPKGLIGESGFDYANLFRNPDRTTAVRPGRLARQVDTVTAAAGLEPQRLLHWILAYAGLGAAWSIEDDDEDGAATSLSIAELALAELRG